MSGAEPVDIKFEDESGLVKEAMELFKVNEDTARQIIDWSLVLAERKFKKWRKNYESSH